MRDEHDYTGPRVRFAATWSRSVESVTPEVFVPLTQPPGEAQFDFGEAVVVIADIRMKAALAVMTLPYSDAFHRHGLPTRMHRDLPGGRTINSFEFFEGVPTKIAYDNTSVAVKKVLDRAEPRTDI